MTHTASTPARLAVGSFARITSTEHNTGRIGEIVHDTGHWYRLRIDNSVAVLYRAHEVEPVSRVEGIGVRVEILASRVRGLGQLLGFATAEGDDAEVIDGLHREVATARAELVAARDEFLDLHVADLEARRDALMARGRVAAAAHVCDEIDRLLAPAAQVPTAAPFPYAVSGGRHFQVVAPSTCCGATYHRPAGAGVGSDWFCMDCGATLPDQLPVR